VETQGRSILIDTATELRIQALREGIRSIDAVLYTHTHADHLHGIDDLRSFSHEKTIPLYGAPQVLEEIRRRFSYIFDPPAGHESSIPHLSLHPVGAGDFPVCGVSVTAVPLKHGEADIYGYRIGGMAYLTDCSRIPESSRALLEGLDILIIDALRPAPHPTHFSIAQAVEEIRRIGPRRALLTHFSHAVEHRAIKKELPPGVAPSYDGLSLRF
jgi:phosphoribosyl 1,2-cyclic phosphate phosphodiesterase